MEQNERAPFVKALGRARMSAYSPGEFVEQESFMTASQIRALAAGADIAPTTRRSLGRRRHAG